MAEKSEVYPFRRMARAKEAGARTKRKPEREKGRRFSGLKNRAKRKPGTSNLPFVSDERQSVRLPAAALLRLLCLGGAGFFLGRAVLLDELTPFAASYTAAAAWAFPPAGAFAALGAIAGIGAAGRNVFLSAAIVLLVLLLTWGLPAKIKNPWLALGGLVFSVSVVVKAGYLAFTVASPYDYIAVLFEGIFAGVCTLVFFFALPALRKIDGVQTLKAEELLCVLVFFAALVAGTGNLQIREISLQGFLSRLIILTTALIGGMGQGAAAGALLGVVPGLASTGVPLIMGAYSFAGLLAGAGRIFGKPGVAVGFLLGNVLLTIFFQNYHQLVAAMSETALALLFFFALPAGLIEKIGASLAPFGATPGNTDRVPAAVAGRMRKWSHIFRELSHSYAATAAQPAIYRKEPALQNLFSEIGTKVCNGCGLYKTCWEREFYRTYQSFLDLFTSVEIYGQVTAEDLPEALQRRCTRGKELAITIACLYDTYKLNRYWMKKFQESKEVFSEQLKSVSEVIEDLTRQLQLELETYPKKEALLKEKLKQAGVPVVEVKIYQGENGRPEVFLKRQPCADRQHCFTQLTPLISRLVEDALAPPSQNCTGPKEGLCSLRLYPGLKYQVRAGVAKTSKGGESVCGDSHAFISLKGGKFAVVLSDGMGVGTPAALQSSTTVSLLEHLLESGLSTALAIKTVNSLMMLRTVEDNFATIDLAVLDLVSGQAEFIKIGAPPGLLARGRRVSQVKAASLPAGIIKDIDVTSVTKNLTKGDLLLLCSDGMLDTYTGPREKEEWAKEVLQDASGLDPQEVADLFLKLAQANAGGEAEIADDITVLAVRLVERKP